MTSQVPRGTVLAHLRPWLAALAALALLQGAAHLAEPPTIALQEAVHHVGERVRVAGRVLDLHTAPGWARVDLSDGRSVLPVTAAGPHVPPLHGGDEVRVAGLVELRGPAAELRSRGVDVRVVHPATAATPLEAVATDPRRYADAPLTAAGTAQAAGDGWVLEGGGVDLPLTLPPGPPPYDGETVGLRGTLRYDASSLAYHLEVATWWRR